MKKQVFFFFFNCSSDDEPFMVSHPSNWQGNSMFSMRLSMARPIAKYDTTVSPKPSNTLRLDTESVYTSSLCQTTRLLQSLILSPRAL